METVKLIIVLLGSVLLQLVLSPIRMIVLILSFFEKLFKVLRNVTQYLINQIENEVLK